MSLTLSDPFCVERHRASFRELITNHVDVLFANEQEICSLYEVEHFDDALQHIRADCHVAALTRSEKGSVIVSNSEIHVIDAEPVGQVIDTTGAGDQYAAGFLFGMVRGLDLALCGRVAGLAAAEIIGHVGARPKADLSKLIENQLGIS